MQANLITMETLSELNAPFPNHVELAELLTEARGEARQIPALPPNLVPTSNDDGYAVSGKSSNCPAVSRSDLPAIRGFFSGSSRTG